MNGSVMQKVCTPTLPCRKTLRSLQKATKSIMGVTSRFRKHLSKSDSDEPNNIDKYRPLVGHLLWYTTKVG